MSFPPITTQSCFLHTRKKLRQCPGSEQQACSFEMFTDTCVLGLSAPSRDAQTQTSLKHTVVSVRDAVSVEIRHKNRAIKMHPYYIPGIKREALPGLLVWKQEVTSARSKELRHMQAFVSPFRAKTKSRPASSGTNATNRQV